MLFFAYFIPSPPSVGCMGEFLFVKSPQREDYVVVQLLGRCSCL